MATVGAPSRVVHTKRSFPVRDAARERVVGYVRVSTDDQADSGAGLEAQRSAIRAECQRRGWQLLTMHEDTASGRSTSGRRGLKAALEAVERGSAAATVVAKLDRLSRSLLDFAALMDRSRRRGWALVALNVGVDTTTPSGEMVVNVLAVFAQFERRLIGQRTREAPAVRRAQGKHRPRSAIRLWDDIAHRRPGEPRRARAPRKAGSQTGHENRPRRSSTKKLAVTPARPTPTQARPSRTSGSCGSGRTR